MKKRIRLKNAWKNREEVIRRCKENGACKPEFKRLKKARTEEQFIQVLFLLILALLMLLASCNMHESITPKDEDECTIGYMKQFKNNSRFIKTTDQDTIRFSYINFDGQPVSGQWIEGVIDWDCIGFNRYTYDYTVTVETATDRCDLLIRAKKNDQ